MKRILSLVILLLAICAYSFAQQEMEVKYRLMFSPQSPLEDTQKTILTDKLVKLFGRQNITSKRGSYVLFADVMINNDGISAGKNPMHSISVSGHVYAVDVLSQQVLSKLEIYGSASGNSPSIAFRLATDSVEIGKAEMMAFFDNALAKIIEYYSEKCNEAIPNARMAMDMGDPQRGLNMLTDIPEMVGFCKEQASEEAKMMFMDYEMMLCEMLNMELTNAVNNKDKKQMALLVAKMAALNSCEERLEQRKPELAKFKIDAEAEINKGKAYRINTEELSGQALFNAMEKTMAYASTDQMKNPALNDMESDEVMRIVMEWKQHNESPKPSLTPNEPTLEPAR